MVLRHCLFPAAFCLLLASVRLAAQQPAAEIRLYDGCGQTYCGSQRDGETRLHCLACQAEREDAWLFADGLWVDIGYDERPGSVLCSWNAFRSAADARGGLHAGAALVWYHVHPRASAPAGVHPPSVEDVLALALLKDLCETDFGGKLEGRVFDGFGLWQLDLSPQLREDLRTPPESDVPPAGEPGAGPDARPGAGIFEPRDVASLLASPPRRRDLAMLAFYLEHERRARAVLDTAGLSRAQTIERYVAEMEGIGLRLRFTELPPPSPETD